MKSFDLYVGIGKTDPTLAMLATLDGVRLPRVELKSSKITYSGKVTSSKITYSGGHFKGIYTNHDLSNIVAYEYLWMRWLNASESP
jgi:hypothetical protein